jgi:nicotianamine synthase
MTAFESDQSSQAVGIGSFGQKERTETVSHTFTPPRTPTATTTCAHRLFAEIQEIYNALSRLPSLAPGEQVNELLTRLVHLCIVPYSAEFTTNFFTFHGVAELCEALRPFCAAAEGELERYWATRIIQEAQTTSMHVVTSDDK